MLDILMKHSVECLIYVFTQATEKEKTRENNLSKSMLITTG